MTSATEMRQKMIGRKIHRGVYRTEEDDGGPGASNQVRADAIIDSPEYQQMILSEIVRSDPSLVGYRARAMVKKINEIIKMVINEVELFNNYHP